MWNIVQCKYMALVVHQARAIQVHRPSELIGRKFHLDPRDGLGGVQTLGARAGTCKP